eukprot:549722-Hanusia_phi.AAC.4
MKCDVCSMSINTSYTIVTANRAPVCPCCSMDSTIMGEYAPYVMSVHKRFELFSGWYVNSLMKKMPEFNYEVYMDCTVPEVPKLVGQEAFKPDLFILIKDGPQPQNISAVHVEFSKTPLLGSKMITRSNNALKSLKNTFPTHRILLLSLYVFVDDCKFCGLFELMMAFYRVLLEAEVAMTSNMMNNEAIKKKVNGVIAFNFSLGQPTVFRFNVMFNKLWVRDFFREILVEPDMHQTSLLVNSTVFTKNVEGDDSIGVYRNFHKVMDVLYTEEVMQLIRADKVGLYYDGNGRSFICFMGQNHQVSGDRTRLSILRIEGLNYREVDMNPVVRKNYLRYIKPLFEMFWNVARYRYHNMMAVQGIKNNGLPPEDQIHLESLKSFELSIKDKESMKLIRYL